MTKRTDPELWKDIVEEVKAGERRKTRAMEC